MKHKRFPAIVLDTSHVRGLSRNILQLLKDRGTPIYISGLALSELAIYFKNQASEQEPSRREKLQGRMRFLTNLLGEKIPLAPTHAPLIDKLGGKILGENPFPFQLWLDNWQMFWNEIANGAVYSIETKAFIDNTTKYVDEVGVDLLATDKAAASLGQPTDEDLLWFRRAFKKFPPMLDNLWLPPPVSVADRFDAYMRILALHATRAYDRSVGHRSKIEPNHAVDINLLQHLADGLIVVTKDYALIEDVDGSGSVQAPWVRTVGEVILNRVPSGPPFAYSARFAKAKHIPRTRNDLRQLDREGEEFAKTNLSKTGLE